MIIIEKYKKISKSCLIFLLAFTLCFFLCFSAQLTHPEHECAGKSCRVCFCAVFLERLIGALFVGFTAVVLVMTAVTAKKILFRNRSFSIKDSPVSLMNVIIS